MSRHLDKVIIFKYLSNKLTEDKETLIQEHLMECDECMNGVEKARKLFSMYEEDSHGRAKVAWYKLLIKSKAFQVAAAVVLIVGITLAISLSRPKNLQIHAGYDSGTILSIDSLSRDSLIVDTLNLKVK